ncbi:hypothetical protein KCP70_01380 [Salmonella enterica subsp. enterica]|nr:hypothetical protein KCP70_01380 [Salmonella enterica subsp. enterica]
MLGGDIGAIQQAIIETAAGRLRCRLRPVLANIHPSVLPPTAARTAWISAAVGTPKTRSVAACGQRRISGESVKRHPSRVHMAFGIAVNATWWWWRATFLTSTTPCICRQRKRGEKKGLLATAGIPRPHVKLLGVGDRWWRATGKTTDNGSTICEYAKTGHPRT